MSKTIINSFNAGELSPYLYARSDFEKYRSGCLVMENFVPLPYGGATRRPAFEYLGDSKQDDQIRLIPFTASVSDSYILELGNEYVRFWKDGELISVLDIPVEIESPWSDTDLKDIKFAQSVDVMWLVHPNYEPQRISRFSDTSWTIGDEVYDYPPLLEANTTDTTLAPSDITGTITLTASDAFFDIGHVGAEFILFHERGSGAAWEGTLIDNEEEESETIDVSSSFWSAGWDGTEGFGFGSAELQRKIGAGAWTVLESGIQWDYNSTVAEASDTFVKIVLTTQNDGAGFIKTDSESSVNNSTTISATTESLDVSFSNWTVTTGGNTWNGRVILERKVGAESWRDYIIIGDTSGVDSKNFISSSDSPESANTFIRIKYTADNTNEFSYNISAEEVYSTGIVKVTAYTSSTLVTGIVVSDILSINPTSIWSESAFSDYRGHPVSIALFESRLCYAGTATNPDTLWTSQIDDYSNFLTGSLDTDALKLTLNSGKLDQIRWMVPQERLVIGTAGSEWSLGSSDERKAITPTGFDLKRKTTYGSNTVQAILVNSAVLFLMRQGRKVREWTPNYNSQDYVAADLSILAEHITEGGVQLWEYQQQPDNILWSIRADGTLLGFTYERDQNVTGWHRHNNDEFLFESLAIIPRDNEEDEVYASVNIDGTRSICRMNDREWGTDYATQWQGSDLYVDYQESGDALHLAGKTVDIVIDGVIQAQEVVDVSGNITATLGTNNIVGLPFTSTLAPVYVNSENQYGTSQGNKTSERKGTARFKDTFSAKVGQTEDSLEKVVFDPDETALYSEDAPVWFDNSSEFLQTCYIVQSDPMPCTALAIIVNQEASR